MSTPEPQPGIMGIQAYVGGGHEMPGVDRVVILSANETPLGPSAKAVSAYRQLADNLHRYPEGGSIDLRRAIAGRFGCDADRIVCGNGSDELIALLVRAYAGQGDEVLYSRHGFLMYPIATRSVGAIPVAAPEANYTVDVDAMLSKVSDKTRITFVANPNNPTGSYISTDEMRRLRVGLPDDVLLVIDSAYAEYVSRNDYSTGAELVEEFDNIVMTRTFSKIFGLAALRLGWAYCPPAVADVLNRIRGPFNVTAAAQAAGIAALADDWCRWRFPVAAGAGSAAACGQFWQLPCRQYCLGAPSVWGSTGGSGAGAVLQSGLWGRLGGRSGLVGVVVGAMGRVAVFRGIAGGGGSGFAFDCRWCYPVAPVAAGGSRWPFV